MKGRQWEVAQGRNFIEKSYCHLSKNRTDLLLFELLLCKLAEYETILNSVAVTE